MKRKRILFDYFSVPVRGLNVKGEEAPKSWLGFTATLVLFSIILAVLFTGLISMFQRQSLTVSIDEEGVPFPPSTNIKSVTMAFGVTNRDEPLVSLTPNVDFIIWAEVRTWQYTNTIPKQIIQISEDIGLGPCSSEYFGSLSTHFANVVASFDSIFCFSRNQADEHLTIAGNLGSENFKEIQVVIECGGPGASSCPSFVTSNIMFYYAASYLDASNYESPVIQTPVAFVDHADITSYREKIILITEREIITDTGFIFENLETTTDLVISEDQTVIEVFPVDPTSKYSFFIRLARKKIIVHREYKKILDVLATTTGVASTIALIVGFVLTPYAELNTHNNIMKTVAPDKFTNISLKDYIKALMGNKAAKLKLNKVNEDKEWIANNLDFIKMIKNWDDIEKIKKVVLTDEQAPLQENSRDGNSFVSTGKNILIQLPVLEYQEGNSFSIMEKNNLMINSSVDYAQLHGKYVS